MDENKPTISITIADTRVTINQLQVQRPPRRLGQNLQTNLRINHHWVSQTTLELPPKELRQNNRTLLKPLRYLVWSSAPLENKETRAWKCGALNSFSKIPRCRTTHLVNLKTQGHNSKNSGHSRYLRMGGSNLPTNPEEFCAVKSRTKHSYHHRDVSTSDEKCTGVWPRVELEYVCKIIT